jgi:murein DD-endopeptidase MepM/ murein hydrolase activator NlpD
VRNKETTSFINRLKNKYRLVILNDDTFEEKLSLRLSRLNVFIVTGATAFLLIAGTILLIALTPLKEYIPGYASTNLKREVLSLAIKADSMEAQLLYTDKYMNNITRILRGESMEEVLNDTIASGGLSVDQRALLSSKEDSIMRLMVEEEDRFNLARSSTDQLKLFAFFPPLKGIVTNGFNLQGDHLGVDIVAPENTPVKTCLAGTVIFAGWTSETGHVIAIQHTQDLVSFYKHNAALLKKQGDQVKTGEAIAILGKTGHLSTGPHLHFELWYNGTAVNPENYISF